MPCFFPKPAFIETLPDGGSLVRFDHCIPKGVPGEGIVLPCGQCIGCRLKKSRDWGLRCVHEAKMHEDNCFVTLTFSPDALIDQCPTGSISQDHISSFMKRLRARVDYLYDGKLRFFGCGEYGSKFGRPHYHLCLFGFDFPDKKLWKRLDKYNYYSSELLSSVWPYGFATVGALNFESAAYVARYCTKKITGKSAGSHYDGRKPEFACMSNRPGIGFSFFEKYGSTDIIPHDSCILDGHKCPVPRYYDQLWEKKDPNSFITAKHWRRRRGQELAEDNSIDRLEVKMKCQLARVKKLCRLLEV